MAQAQCPAAPRQRWPASLRLHAGRTQRNFARPNRAKSIMETTTRNASDFVSRLIPGPHSALGLVAVVVLGLFALYVFLKIEHFLMRLAAGLLGLALVTVAVWWFFAHR